MAGQFSGEQRANAATIAAVGRQLGASERDILIAVMTAMQESGLRNINYGDRDSIGLFQQRDAWGSTSARLDPVQSAKMFFLGGADGQRGLLDFADRDNLSLTQAAQAVQVSAFPDAYAKHESGARNLLGGADIANGATSSSLPAPALPAPAQVVTVDNTVTQTTPLARTPGQQTQPQVPGAEAVTAPGAEATAAPGAQATAAPGAQAAVPPGYDAGQDAPAAPDYYMPQIDQGAFAQLFPDAADTGLFTGMYSGKLDGRRADIISTAMSFQGTPYAWGGTSRDGVDCSGLVSTVLGMYGVDMPRLSADQARAGRVVPLDQLQPGDLVAIDNSSRNNGADHIAIYAGNGEIIEAPRTGLTVRRRKIGANETGWYGVKLDF